MHQGIEPHFGQEWNEQKETRGPRSDTQWFMAGKDQFLSVGDRGEGVVVMP